MGFKEGLGLKMARIIPNTKIVIHRSAHFDFNLEVTRQNDWEAVGITDRSPQGCPVLRTGLALTGSRIDVETLNNPRIGSITSEERILAYIRIEFTLLTGVRALP